MANHYKKEGLFTVSQVHKYSEIPITTLQDWHNKGFFRASVVRPVSDVDSYFYTKKGQGADAVSERKKGEIRLYTVDDIKRLHMILILQKLGIKKQKEIENFLLKMENDPDTAYEKLADMLIKKISYLKKLATLLDRMYKVGAQSYVHLLTLTTVTLEELINDLPEYDFEEEDKEHENIEDTEENDNPVQSILWDILIEISKYMPDEDRFKREGMHLLDKLNEWCEENLMKEISQENLYGYPPIFILVCYIGDGGGIFARDIEEMCGKGSSQFIKKVMVNYLTRGTVEKMVNAFTVVMDKYKELPDEEFMDPAGECIQDCISLIVESIQSVCSRPTGQIDIEFNEVYEVLMELKMFDSSSSVSDKEMEQALKNGYEIWKKNHPKETIGERGK